MPPSIRSVILLSGVLTMLCPISLWDFFLYHTLHHKKPQGTFDFDFKSVPFVAPLRIMLTEDC
jgi:hypothetical protein